MVFRTKNNSIIQTLSGINTLGIAPERKKKRINENKEEHTNVGLRFDCCVFKLTNQHEQIHNAI